MFKKLKYVKFLNRCIGVHHLANIIENNFIFNVWINYARECFD